MNILASRVALYDMGRWLAHTDADLLLGHDVPSDALGVDEDDRWQAIVAGLLRKAQSERSRWDPTRGSLPTWVCTAVNGLVLNLVEAHENAEAPAGTLGIEDNVAVTAGPDAETPVFTESVLWAAA